MHVQTEYTQKLRVREQKLPATQFFCTQITSKESTLPKVYVCACVYVCIFVISRITTIWLLLFPSSDTNFNVTNSCAFPTAIASLLLIPVKLIVIANGMMFEQMV